MSPASRHNWFGVYTGQVSAHTATILFKKPGVIAFLIVQDGRTSSEAELFARLRAPA